jgi:tripartite-type tricarboxylate transporter receptor subunit TctC
VTICAALGSSCAGNAWLSERLGQQFIVENRPGATANLAVEAVVRAPADGYTLGTVGPSSVLNSTLHQQVNFDLNRDLATVAGLSSPPLVLSPAKLSKLVQDETEKWAKVIRTAKITAE